MITVFEKLRKRRVGYIAAQDAQMISHFYHQQGHKSIMSIASSLIYPYQRNLLCTIILIPKAGRIRELKS